MAVSTGFHRFRATSVAVMLSVVAVVGLHRFTAAPAASASAPSPVAWPGQARTLPGNLAATAVSCPTSTFCMAVGNGGQRTIFDGTTWSLPTDVADGIALIDVDCPSANVCLAIDAEGSAVAYDVAHPKNGSPWWPAKTNLEGASLTSVSCNGTSSCMAAGTDGKVHRYFYDVFDGGIWTWQPGISIDPGHSLVDISCSTGPTCTALDDASRFVNGWIGSWSSPVSYDGSPGEGTVSCPTATFCMVVSAASGESYSLDGTTSTPRGTVGADPGNVSCSSETVCVVSRTRLPSSIFGYASKVYSGGSWQTVDLPGDWVTSIDILGVPVPSIDAFVSCVPASTSCVMAGGRQAAASVPQASATIHVSPSTPLATGSITVGVWFDQSDLSGDVDLSIAPTPFQFGGWTFTGSITPSLNIASKTFTGIPRGDYNVEADYPGDSTHSAAHASGTFHVTGVATSATVSADPNPVAAGQSVTLDAFVSPPDATGAMTFHMGNGAGTTLGTATLDGGHASLSIDALSVRDRPVWVSYSGDATHEPSTSARTTVTVTAAALLRVTTSPPVPSRITVDGNFADTWGVTWAKEASGDHEICFSDVPGFTTPDCSTVTLTAGATTTVTGSFAARGYLHVTTSPPVPSQISIDGIPRDDWGVYTDLAPGSHQVCFGAVADHTPPACQSATVTAGTTTDVQGTFTSTPGTPGQSGLGTLRVTTFPALPSQISVDGVAADTWGLDWLELAPGPHTVCFSDVQGYETPSCRSISITAGATAVVQGSFTARGYLQVTTSPAVAATISVDGIPRDDWGLYTDVPLGAHTVCFGTVPGYAATPACRDVAVTSDATASVVGEYS